jgi:hypothetical protein
MPEFFDASGLVHHELFPHGHTVASHFCMQGLQRLHDVVQRKGRAILHDSDMPSHTLLVVQQFLTKNIPVIT